MKKRIIAAMDGTKFSKGTIDYAIRLAKLSGSEITGIFLHDIRYLSMTYSYVWDQPFIDFATIAEIEAEDAEKIARNVSLFTNECKTQNVSFTVKKEKGIPINELLRESTYADVIIADENLSFYSLSDANPSPFIKDLLAESRCPVLIVPMNYEYFDKVIFCYDGSPSSTYAMKQFSYLFAELEDMEAVVVSVNEGRSKDISGGESFKDLANVHFPKATLKVLNGTPESQLLNYLKIDGANSIVVMGAYGRNAISRVFEQSMSNKIIRELNLPMFIAHL